MARERQVPDEAPAPEAKPQEGGKAEEPEVQEVNIGDEEEWIVPPVVTFDQEASLHIAKWVLAIFAGVYFLSFVMSFCMFCMKGATYDGALELVKFLLGSILPLVTLAVGFYLGDKGGVNNG